MRYLILTAAIVGLIGCAEAPKEKADGHEPTSAIGLGLRMTGVAETSVSVNGKPAGKIVSAGIFPVDLDFLCDPLTSSPAILFIPVDAGEYTVAFSPAFEASFIVSVSNDECLIVTID